MSQEKPKHPQVAMSAVKSSQIAECGHCAKTNTLAVKFKNGGVYHYANVPADIHQKLLEAESVGKAFSKLIRGGGFKHTKIGA
jgi:hypothetical protein